jgi:hypothetical protein
LASVSVPRTAPALHRIAPHRHRIVPHQYHHTVPVPHASPYQYSTRIGIALHRTGIARIASRIASHRIVSHPHRITGTASHRDRIARIVPHSTARIASHASYARTHRIVSL